MTDNNDVDDTALHFPLLIALTLFCILWGALFGVMFLSWLFQGSKLDTYGALTAGVAGYGILVLVTSALIFQKLTKPKKLLLWTLYLPLPALLFALLELAY